MLVPLSSVDQAGVESSLSVFGYVLPSSPPLDAAALRSACVRLVDKWRLLAGAVVWVPPVSSYAIRVPLGPLKEDRVHFTESEEKGLLDLQGGEMGGHSEAKTVKTPAMKYFVHKETQGGMGALAKSGRPILNVHVARFGDYTCACPLFPPLRPLRARHPFLRVVTPVLSGPVSYAPRRARRRWTRSLCLRFEAAIVTAGG